MTELVYGIAVAPFKDMVGSPAFLVEVLLGAVVAGLMYSLVALGFVLIFKASGVFNFAQGVMVLCAALPLVGLLERGVPVVGALLGTTAVMVALAWVIERVVLRPLVNQEHIILFMATIGLTFFLEGFGEMVWGANVKKLDIGIPDRSFIVRGVQINQLELTAAVTSAVLVTVLALFFRRTRIGRALRAVADDHEAALSIGIPLKTIWIVVWSVAGVVAIVAGLMWGAKSGVQFSLSLIALKAPYGADQAVFPVAQDRVVVAAAVVAAFLVPPLVASEYWLQAVLIPFLVYALAAIGLNLLTGYAGQLSLGTGGFMAVGAYSAFKLATAFPDLNIIVVFLLSGLVAAGVGLLFGIPSLRIKGFYLAVATLASQFFLIWLFNKVAWFTNYASSGTITAPDRTLFGALVTGPNSTAAARYLTALGLVAVFAVVAKNLVRGR